MGSKSPAHQVGQVVLFPQPRFTRSPEIEFRQTRAPGSRTRRFTRDDAWVNLWRRATHGGLSDVAL